MAISDRRLDVRILGAHFDNHPLNPQNLRAYQIDPSMTRLANSDTFPQKPEENGAEQVADPFKFPDVSNEVKEIAGPTGLEPTRYGDWERKGRCIDF